MIPMLGTLVNTAAILAGSLAGSALKKGLGKKYQNALYDAMGFAAAFLGINAVASNLPRSEFPVLFILSLAAGSVVGERLDLDGRFQRLVDRVSGGGLAQGLSTGILLCCVGTLSILGPIQSALGGDNTYLFTNATLDFVTFLVLGSTYGVGMCAAAGVLFLWQGTIYLGASALQGFLQGGLLCELSIVGGVLIAASGLSILKIKHTKALNMLPSLLVPVLWYGGRALLGL